MKYSVTASEDKKLKAKTTTAKSKVERFEAKKDAAIARTAEPNSIRKKGTENTLL